MTDGGFQTFLSPIEELELKDAVRARKKKVTLGGRDFTIKYERDKVWVQTVKWGGACGWFKIDRIGEFSDA